MPADSAMMDLNCQFACDGQNDAGKNIMRCVHCGRIVITPHVKVSALCKSEAPRVDCVHRGAMVGKRECASCAGTVKLKLFACAIHGECTLAKPLEGVACCGACREFEGKSGT